MSQEAIETIYTVPFFPKLNNTPRYKRAPRAIKLLKEYIIKHTKADFVVITNELNEYMWKRGIEKPPRKITVRAIVESFEEERIATVELIHEKVEVEARPDLRGVTIPGELEPEEEDEEEDLSTEISEDSASEQETDNS